MKILVTGGAGFIGSHIVDKLIELGEEVLIVDNLSTGKKENVNKKAKFYEQDICSEKLESIFKKENFNSVIHQAAQASVITSIEKPDFDAKVNILGSINLLECCRKFSVSRIVYASSAAIYGNPHYLSVNEKHPIAPSSAYGVSKYFPELYLRLYNSLYGLSYAALRYSNVYGPRQDPHGEAGVVAVFSNNLANNRKSTIFGDGRQTRDFIHVNDVAEANVAALKSNACGEFNISTNKETSVNELYEKMQKIAGKKIPAVYAEKRKGEILRSVLDNGKAIEKLDWKPKIGIDDGLTSIN